MSKKSWHAIFIISAIMTFLLFQHLAYDVLARRANLVLIYWPFAQVWSWHFRFAVQPKNRMPTRALQCLLLHPNYSVYGYHGNIISTIVCFDTKRTIGTVTTTLNYFLSILDKLRNLLQVYFWEKLFLC